MKQKLKSGDEYDAVSKIARSYKFWKPNQLKKINRALNKRVRRDGKKELMGSDKGSEC